MRGLCGTCGGDRDRQHDRRRDRGLHRDPPSARRGEPREIQRGSLDDYRLDIPDLFLPELQPGGRYARTLRAGAGKARYLLNPALYVRAFALNGERPMFRDPAARRAVNYAIDRRALAGLFGADPTDQYVPRAMPGFRDARVYPDEPDLAKARALLGARGGRAVFWTCGGVVCRQVGEIVRRELRPIGIDVAIRQYDDWDARTSEPGAAYDILDVALPVDFGDPAAALEPLLGGDPALAPRLRRAAGLTGSARLAAYAAIDRLAARGSAPLAAFANDNAGELVSARVGCDVYQAVYGGVSLAALCARG